MLLKISFIIFFYHRQSGATSDTSETVTQSTTTTITTTAPTNTTSRVHVTTHSIAPQVNSVSSVRQQAVVAPTIAEHYGRHMAHPAPAIIYPRNTSGYPNCPDVRLKPLAFYDVLATLLRPSTLIPSTASRSQEITFPLHLTPSQIQEIVSHRDMRNENETLIQVQLRFCLMETSCEQEDYFPPGIQVRVNNKIVQLPVSTLHTYRPLNYLLNLWCLESYSYKQTWCGT